MSEEFVYLGTNVLIQYADELLRSEASIDQRLAQYLRGYSTHEADVAPLATLGVAAQQLKLIPSTSVAFDSVDEKRAIAAAKLRPLRWGKLFIKEILTEIRKVICGPRKEPTKLGTKSQTVIATVAGVIITKFRIHSTTATALAILVLLTLSEATKKAFCKMTDPEVLAALAKSE